MNRGDDYGMYYDLMHVVAADSDDEQALMFE